MFDLERIKRESGLASEQLDVLERQLRAEFPHDELMFELHLLRLLDAVRLGWISVETALTEDARQA